MPAFDVDVRAASADVDAVFAEDFVLRPYARGANVNDAPGPDGTRDVVCLKGVFTLKVADWREPESGDGRQTRRPGVASGVAHVEFSTAATAALCGFAVRDGDHVERVETGVTYVARAAFVSPNGLITVPLNRLGATA